MMLREQLNCLAFQCKNAFIAYMEKLALEFGMQLAYEIVTFIVILEFESSIQSGSQFPFRITLTSKPPLLPGVCVKGGKIGPSFSEVAPSSAIFRVHWDEMVISTANRTVIILYSAYGVRRRFSSLVETKSSYRSYGIRISSGCKPAMDWKPPVAMVSPSLVTVRK